MSAISITTNSLVGPYRTPSREKQREPEHLSLQGSKVQVVEQVFFGLVLGGFVAMAASFVTSFLV